MRGIDDAGLDQRQESELDRGRIAAGIADDAGLGNGGAVHFRQSVHRFGEQVGAGVRHLVPALELGGVLEPEVGREVDDLDTGADQLARLAHRDAVRRREKDDLASLRGRLAPDR